MSLDKYQQAWKVEALQGKVAFDAEELTQEVQRSHEAFRAMIVRQHLVQVALVLAMIPFWWLMGIITSATWTWYLTMPVMLWIAVIYLLNLKHYTQRPSEPSEPLLVCAKVSLAQVERQIWLMRNLLWWNVLPAAVAMMAFFIDCAWEMTHTWWGCMLVSVFCAVFMCLLYGWGYRTNELSVRKELEPRRSDLQKLIQNLEGENTESENELRAIVTTLSETDGRIGGYISCGSGAENWNRLIPTWREVAIIIGPTLAGAYLGYRFPFADIAPDFPRSVIAAVFLFLIALLTLSYRSFRRHQGQPLPAAGTVRLKAPAIVAIIMLTVISILVFVALFLLQKEATSRLGGTSEDDRAFFEAVGGDIADGEITDGETAGTDAWLRGLADAFYPSLSAVVIRDGEIVYRGAFGFADIDVRQAATAKTQYHVASVTKVFTASLAVMLHEKGIVDLDQPVATYLPAGIQISSKPDLGATITLRQLASHTSGLPRGIPGEVQSVEGRYELEPQRLYDLLANVELTADPGDDREYSNLGFGLLGHALERAANKPFDQLLQELLCEPLQLDDTGIEGNATLHPAKGYEEKGRGGEEESHSVKNRLAGSGGLVTTTDDLAKFLMAQLQPGVFTREVLDQLHTETQLISEAPSGTALGWSIDSVPGAGRILEKNGGRSNCTAWIGFSPELKVAVAVIANSGGPDVDLIGHRLLSQAIPPSSRKSPTDGGYTKVAPFTGVRWKNDRPIVCVRGTWLPLVSINDIPIDHIMEFANKEFGSIARKRFAEDLVEVLSKMGHDPDWQVTLGLKNEDAQIETLQVPMTEANRVLVRE